MIDDRPCDRDTLLLSAGELCRHEAHAVLQSDALQGFDRALSALPHGNACIEQRQLHIFQRRLPRQQIEILKNKAELFIPDRGKILVRAFHDIHAVKEEVALGLLVQTADDIHQRRFSGAGGSHDRDIFALIHRHCNILQNRDSLLALHIVLIY